MSKADKLRASASFTGAGAVSARRAAIEAVTGIPTERPTEGPPRELALHRLSHNPDNPRESLGNVDTMADTLQEVGQLQAITVATVHAYLAGRPDRHGDLEPGADYVVVDGHRRLAAARQLGWAELKVMVDDAQVSSDEKLLEAAFVANTQREDMTDLEQATALQKLVRFYGSQNKAAKRLGMSQSNISYRLSLLKLTPELQADLNEGRRSVEHVRGLAKLSAEEQKAKADERAAAATVPPARESSVAGPTPATYHAVITPEPVPAPEGPVTPTRAAALADRGVRPATADAGEDEVLPPLDWTPAGMPWDDPPAVLALLRAHMSPDGYRLLVEALAQETGPAARS